MATEKLIVELDAKTQKLDAALKKTTKGFDDLDKSVGDTDENLKDFDSSTDKSSKSILSMNKALVAAGVAFGVLANETRKAIGLADEYAVSQARTEAVLRATGNAVGFTSEQLREQADALALNTLTSTKEVQAAQAQLLTFNKVTGDVFTEAIELSQDLAELGFGSISSASVMLGKALQDPITGVSSLARVGVSLTEQQKDQIKVFAEAGKAAEAQRIILGALQDQVGGAGTSVAANSLAGKLDTAGQKYDEFTSTLANRTGLVDLAKDATDLFVEALEKLNEALQGDSLEDQLIKSNFQIERQQESIAKLTAEAERLSQVNTATATSSQGLAAILSAQKQVADDLASAQSSLSDSIIERDRIQSEIDEKQLARSKAIADAEKVQDEIRVQELRARAEEEAAIEAEKIARIDELNAQAREREQAVIDAKAQRILESGLAEEEQALLNAERQLEIIEQSNLDELEKVDARYAIWEAYYQDIAKLRDDDVKSAKKSSQREGQIGQDSLRAATALNTAFLDDNKAVRAGLVVADTAAGIVRQFSDLPYPAALASSAAIAAVGAAQLATISSSSKGSSSTPSVPSSPPPAVEQPESPQQPQDLVASAGDVSGSNRDTIIQLTLDGDIIAETVLDRQEEWQVSGVRG